MPDSNRILVTGATGKVGQTFIHRLLEDPAYSRCMVRALCHHRVLEENERLEVVSGSIEHRQTVENALDGVSHGIHLATCKETPDQIMDVAVKGLFWLLETCRSSQTFQQFILIGGDAGVGHFVYPHRIPVTETQRHSAYPGCYALSKVLEEVMLEQYYIQYNLVNAILLALDHWAARQQTFNICMDEPVDYAEVAAYLAASRGLPSVEIKSPYPSTWLDNTKAKFLLGWRPGYDLKKMIDAAWEYRRAEDDPRFTWYPG